MQFYHYPNINAYYIPYGKVVHVFEFLNNFRFPRQFITHEYRLHDAPLYNSSSMVHISGIYLETI